MLRRFNISKLILVIFMMVNVVLISQSINATNEINAKIQQMEKAEIQRMEATKDIINTVQTISSDVDIIKSQKPLSTRRVEQPSRGGNIDRTIPKEKEIPLSKLTSTTDLCAEVDLDEDDMNKIIDSWDVHVKNGTPFKNKGRAFIEASRETGLNPIYILAHAAWESNWGKSYLAKNRSNYFGISAFDSDPDKAYAMGDSVDEGIIQGAKWIKKEYYDNGCTTLDGMIYNNTRGAYASDQSKWISGIVSIANSSYRVL